MAKKKLKLRKWIRCPHCWHRFRPWDCVFIASHDSLRGDPVLGDDAFVRFLPSRFTSNGHAIDPNGSESRDVACPRCHLQIPRSILELPLVTISIVGAPSSGKSYYLAAMTNGLRRALPQLGWTIADADPAANTLLHEQEEKLFLASRPDKPVRLEKTDVASSRLYHSVRIDEQVLTLPKPFQFTITNPGANGAGGHVLVLYDNAGEHFLPGNESMREPVTEHLTHSDIVFFLLDPTQDPRIRAQIRSLAGEPVDGCDDSPLRQELVLNETIVRIRKSLGLPTNEKHKALLMIVLAKADVWAPLLGHELNGDEPVRADSNGVGKFDFNSIGYTSKDCRAMLSKTSPEVVSIAESSFSRVIYVPVSATGGPAEEFRDGDAMQKGYRPQDIRPKWVLAPIACALGYVEPHLGPQAGASRASSGGGS